MNILQSPEGIKRYAHIQKYYDFKDVYQFTKKFVEAYFENR